MRARRQTGLLFSSLAVGLCGCPAEPLVPGPVSPPDCGTMVATFPARPARKLDLLFMLDNSGPEQMLSELRNRMPVLLDGLDRLAKAGVPLDVHIGAVTSDYGAGATGAPGCSRSPGGQQGRLQGIGVKAPQNCKKPVGANFVQYAFEPGGAGANNLPQGQSLPDTLACMFSVGASGCGFEHLLEAVHAALKNNLPENVGFLRDDAVLAVFFVTDEDDASAPADTDLFDKSKFAEYGYESSYPRQTRFGVLCCPPGRADCRPEELTFPPYDSSRGPLAGCMPAPNDPTGAGPGRLFDVRRYFARELKPDPNDVIFLGVIGPTTPFEVILTNPGTLAGQSYPICPALNESGNPPCTPVLQYACIDPKQPEFFGKPAVRLEAVIRSAPIHYTESACTTDYTSLLTAAGRRIADRFLAPACLPEKIAGDCLVGDVTQNPDGTTTIVAIPSCEAAPGGDSCYRLERRGECAGRSPDSMSLIIERSAPAPANFSVVVQCERRC